MKLLAPAQKPYYTTVAEHLGPNELSRYTFRSIEDREEYLPQLFPNTEASPNIPGLYYLPDGTMLSVFLEVASHYSNPNWNRATDDCEMEILEGEEAEQFLADFGLNVQDLADMNRSIREVIN